MKPFGTEQHGPINGPRTGESRRSHHLSPEVPEPIRRQFGIAHRVLDVFVPEPGL
jgi:hypothetical protein